MARVSIFLIVVALIAGMVSCGPAAQYTLTISSTAGGSTIPGEGTHTYDAGEVVNLVATPTLGYRFVNWTGNVGTIGNVTAAATNITMNDNYLITANFEKEEYDLSGSWTLYMTPQNGEEEGPYCIYITQPDNIVNYLDWHKDYCMLVSGNIDGDDIVSSGESIYYGQTVFYSATAITDGNIMTGTYNYTGAYNEEGDLRAIKAECKTAKGWVRVANIQGDYALDFYLWDLIDDGISIASATVTGPNIGTLSLNVNSQTSYFLGQTQPIAGEIYTFNVNYSDETVETTTGYVRETFVDFPTSLLPADGEVINTFTPTFSWEPPSCECQGYYRIWVVNSQGDDVWSVYLSKETTSVVYNFDGQGNALQSGETYEWRLIAFDEPISGGVNNNVWVLSTFTVQ